MYESKKIIGFFIAKVRDLESAYSGTTPPEKLPLSFSFVIDPKSNKLDMVSALNAYLDMGCFPVALLWRDLKSDEISVGHLGSSPVWLRTMISSRAPDLINDEISCLTGAFNWNPESGANVSRKLRAHRRVPDAQLSGKQCKAQ